MRTIKSTLHPCPWLMKTEPNKPCASLPLQVSKEVEGLLAMAVFSEVGYGTNTLFSCDKWLNGRSIRDRYGRQGLPRVPVALGEGPVALGGAFPECQKLLTRGRLHQEAKKHSGKCRDSLPPAVNLYRSCVGLGWLAQETTEFRLVRTSEE
jgi:hypothetical protein